jgi:hypothetical protein
MTTMFRTRLVGMFLILMSCVYTCGGGPHTLSENPGGPRSGSPLSHVSKPAG